MNNITSSNLIDRLKVLIHQSCKSQEEHVTYYYNNFHKAILKKYYRASDVDLEHTRTSINITLRPYEALQTNKLIAIEVPRDKMEDFLLSCIEDDITSLAFYKNMLGYYYSPDNRHIMARMSA